jgi:hypothetical protein
VAAGTSVAAAVAVAVVDDDDDDTIAIDASAAEDDDAIAASDVDNDIDKDDASTGCGEKSIETALVFRPDLPPSTPPLPPPLETAFVPAGSDTAATACFPFAPMALLSLSLSTTCRAREGWTDLEGLKARLAALKAHKNLSPNPFGLAGASELISEIVRSRPTGVKPMIAVPTGCVCVLCK